ncbi:MAG: SMI1/KNR4 family protein [Sandaracinaceae bacterium]
MVRFSPPLAFTLARADTDVVGLLSDEAIDEARRKSGLPEFLVPFCQDAFGNFWCFDRRFAEAGEYPIVFWNHEEPAALLADDPPDWVDPFSSWLEERQAEAKARRRHRSQRARREAIEQHLAPHLPTSPYTPNEDQVDEVTARLPFDLPLQYRWFTIRFGAVSWPVEIADALDLPALQTSADAIWFGREPSSRFGLNKRGNVVTDVDGKVRVVAGSFLLWLEAQIELRQTEDSRRAAEREKRSKATRTKVIRRKRQ